MMMGPNVVQSVQNEPDQVAKLMASALAVWWNGVHLLIVCQLLLVITQRQQLRGQEKSLIHLQIG